LSLFAAGVALLALLIASYTRRSTWIALGSMAISMAVLFGCLFLSTIHGPNQLRTRFAWIASKLPLVLDQQTVDDLATALEHIPASRPCDGQRPACGTAASGPSPPAERETVQAAATAGWFETKQEPKATSQSPVAWHLDDRDVQPASTDTAGFLISGTNVSDQTLEEVRAVLKPDASQRELELALSVEGDGFEAGTVIPPGARFSLVSVTANEDGSKQSGGAILRFRYVQAGQRKTSILYLTPSMIGRLANRG
jgi:hypothetical protein